MNQIQEQIQEQKTILMLIIKIFLLIMEIPMLKKIKYFFKECLHFILAIGLINAFINSLSAIIEFLNRRCCRLKN